MLDSVFFGNSVMQYLEVVAMGLGVFLASKLVYWALKNAITPLTKKTKTQLDEMIVKRAETPLVALVVVTGLYYAITRLSLDGARYWVDSGAYLLIVGILTWLAVKIADVLVENWLKPFTEKTKNNLDKQLAPIMGAVIKIAVVFFAFIIVLSHFNYDITALVAGLGVGGIAIALALKDYLENIIAGITIFTDKPFRMGDRVQLGDLEGTVLEVGIRSTKIMTFDETLVIVPNMQMVTNKLTNVSAPKKSIGVRVTLGLTYGTSVKKIEQAKEIIKECIKSTEGVDAEYEPIVYFLGFGDFALKLWFKYRVSDLGNRLSVTDQVNLKIKKGFEKAKIEMAFPTQTIHLQK